MTHTQDPPQLDAYHARAHPQLGNRWGRSVESLTFQPLNLPTSDLTTCAQVDQLGASHV